MQREQAHPAGCMNSILMRVTALMGDLVRHIVDGDDPVKQGDDNEDEQTRGEEEGGRSSGRSGGRVRGGVLLLPMRGG